MNATTISDTDIAIIRNMTTYIEPPLKITMGTVAFDDVLDLDISTQEQQLTLIMPTTRHACAYLHA